MADLGKSRHGIPDVVMIKIDKYVDSLGPEIQPRVAAEIDEFQTKTIDQLEDLVVDAFRSLFDRGKDAGPGSRSLGDSPPDSYGIGSLPFANEIAALTQSISKVADGASDDIRDIFDLTEDGGAARGDQGQQSRGVGSGDSFRDGARGFLSAALDAVKEHRGSSGSPGGGQPPISLDGLLGVLSGTVKETSRNPEGKARMISPEIKEKIGAVLQRQHAPLAEQFTRIALDHIKRWLRGNTSTRDLGDGVKGEINELVSGIAGMFGSKKSSSSSGGDRSRAAGSDGDEDGGAGGFSGIISKKLSTGLAKVHRETRLEFRNVLGGIEKNLFEALPDEVQGPLEKILGGNPFDPSLDAQANSRGIGGGGGGNFGDEIKAKLVGKIRNLMLKVQESLRQNVLTVVNGGHRRFERQTWVFVQTTVEAKVQRFLPDVRIHVPDDIGNEGVDVGAPQTQVPPVPQGGGGGGGGFSASPPLQGQYQQGGHSGGAQDSYYNSQPPPPPPQQTFPQHQSPGYGAPPPSQQSYNQYPPPPSDQYRPHDQRY